MRAEHSQARLVELAIAIEDAEGNSA